jgi:murein L,D-transpeptidase YcbB/YkuD
MKRFLPYLFLLLLFFSCAPEPKKTVISIPLVDYKNELDTYFYSNFKEIDSAAQIQNIALDSVHWINSFYSKNGHKAIWINDSIEINKKGKNLIEKFTESRAYGISSYLYNTPLLYKLKQEIAKIKNKKERYHLASEIEILLTNFYMLYGKHLNYGVLESIDSITKLPRKKFIIDIPNYVHSAYEKDSLLEKLFELQPKQEQYLKLQKKLVNYLNTSSLTTDNIIVENFRIDSVKSIQQSKKALILHKYLDTITNDSIYFEGLKKFQRDHGLKPDGLIGKNTAMALSMSPFEYYQTLAANLERWRWKDKMQSEFIFVNIPAFKLEVNDNGIIKLKSKIVVGKKKNQTPEIKDSIQYIIAYPYWNVPRKISVKEILVKAQKDSSYLKRNDYEVLTYKKDSVNIDSVNWNELNEDNFNYLIRQKGGVSNALGFVKFIFPNKYAIYLHDTPSKHYFNYESRAFSHGCVRVEKAMQLADYILETDNNKYTLDSLYKFIDKKKEKAIKLKNRLPVYLYYFTASVDENEKLIFYNDIYGYDKKLIAEMAKQQSIK